MGAKIKLGGVRSRSRVGAHKRGIVESLSRPIEDSDRAGFDFPTVGVSIAVVVRGCIQLNPFEYSASAAQSMFSGGTQEMDRRQFSTVTGAAAMTVGLDSLGRARVQSEKTKGAKANKFRLRYMLASCLFGYQYIGEILPAVRPEPLQ